MQSTSQTWRDLFAAGAPLQARATIGGVAYTDISAPVITRALMQDRLSVGNVVSASLALAVRGAVNIPRSAAVVIEARLNDGQTASEWLPQGTFYISRRMRDPVTGLLALECYDALLKANAVWAPSAGTWPRTLAAVTAELVALLGVTLDSRTVIPTGAAYAMSEPAEGMTIRDALSMIAQAAGGNWIMTPGNRLRLVRVGESGGTADVAGVVGGIDVGQAGTITGVRSTVDGLVTLIGDDTGIVVDVTVAPMIAADMAEDLIGQAYAPFRLTGAVYDPAAELGDGVRAGAGGEVVSALCGERAVYGPAFRGDIAAPDPGELTDEYPYIGSANKTLALAKAAVTEAVGALDDELTQQEIFNRLTDNGAAQGLVLLNGQLYMNATYMRSGTIDGDYVNAKKFIVVDENNNVIASFDSRITLGKSTNTIVELDYNSFEIKGQSGSVFLKLGDARDEQGRATVQDTYVGDGNNTNFLLHVTPTTINSVKVDGVTVSNWSLSDDIVMMTTAPAKGAVVVITYVTEQPVYHYTLGTRDPNDGIGIWSVAEGYYVGASGFASHAEGQATNAPGYISHAEGYYSTADGYAAHAEGYNTEASGGGSHAEGWETEASGTNSHTEGNSTEASGECGHAEGGDTVASGNYSHAEGRGTIASGTAQHVVGKYNVSDDLKLEIVGNGTNDSNRSNARTLDESGNEWIAGALSVGNAATTRANIGAVAKSGDTMTGNLTIQHGGDVLVHVKNTNTNNSLFLYNPDNGWQGLYTFGYWNGSSYVNDAKWLIYRSTDGNVYVNGNAANVTGTVSLGNGGTGVIASSNEDLRDKLGVTAAIAALASTVVQIQPGATDASLASLRTNGIYYVNGVNNLNDSPDGNNGYLIVFGIYTLIVQIWLPYRTPGTNDNHVYIRKLLNAQNFGAWAQYTGAFVS